MCILKMKLNAAPLRAIKKCTYSGRLSFRDVKKSEN
jgi:hypothetical protein